jgi:hypothetical protein
MKLVLERSSLLLRLAATAAIVLFSQQSLAAGTQAGTVVSNTATVDYNVNTVAQTPITSTPATFTVDNRVDFTIVATPNTPVVPTLTTVGDTGVAVEFLLMNTGNQTQDYSFVPTNEVDGTDVDGFIDTDDMAALTVVVDTNGNGLPDDAAVFIDELAPDTTQVVWIVADTPALLLNGDIANMLLTATTRDGGAAGQGAVTVASGADNPNAEDVVLAVAGVLGAGDGSAQNTFQVESAALTIAKAELLISDPFNGTTGPFHIPGAVVEYSIDVANASTTTDALNVQIADTLTDVAITDGDIITLTNGVLGGVAAVSCTADLTDTDGDGCGLVQVSPTQQDLVFGNATADFTVGFGTTLTITFQATIL